MKRDWSTSDSGSFIHAMMASPDLKDELACSICLSLYTDPVSLRCGHNFCRSCIVSVLDAQEDAGVYSCPDCRAEYPECPALEKNRKLGNIVERFLSTQPKREKTRIFCTYCTKSPVPAVKSCLQCENALCDDHLTAHNKTADHVVTEPTDFFGNKKCSTHKKVLEYYCPQDAACLCVSCCLVGKHRGHQVELLDEASEKKKKKLRKYLDGLNQQKAELLKRIQNFHTHKKNIQEKASKKRKNISMLFTDIKKQLEMAEKKVQSEISRQEDKIVSQISQLIKELEIEKNELFRKMHHVEEMCRVTDPISLLQESDIKASSDGDNEDKSGDGGQVNSEGDLDAGLALAQPDVHVSDTKVEDNWTDPITVLQELDQRAALISEATEKKQQQQLRKDLDEDLISLTLHRLMRDVLTIKASELGFQVSDILLDVDTAYTYVELSEDLKTAIDSEEEQNRPETPGRFQTYFQVLSRCGFSSGRHYWEIKWNQIGTCGIGMSYLSIEREGEQSGIGYNDKSWCLDICDETCEALHESVTLLLNVKPTCPTFGVFLDYEAGRLSFYELCDPIRHLHTFTASFTEPLHVAFYVGDGASVTITS